MKGQNLSHLIHLLEEQEEKERHLAPEERYRLKKQREEEARQEYILRMTPVADAAADDLVAQVQQEKKERRRARQKQKQRQLKARQKNAKQQPQQENEENEEEEGEKEKEEELKEEEKVKDEEETKRRKEAEEERQERELVETDYVGEWQTKQTHKKKKKKHGNRNQRDRRKRNQRQMSATMEGGEEQEEGKKKTSPPVSPFQVTFLNNLRQNELEEKLVLLSKAPQPPPPPQTEEDGSTAAATTKAKWEPILSDYLSQTDYLNRTLLQSFLNNMDSLQCKWADEEEEEYDGEEALQQHSRQDECEFSDGSFCASSEDEKEKGAGEGERQGEEEWNPLYERNLAGKKKTKTIRKKVESKHETTTTKPQFEALLERVQQKRRQKWEEERSRETSETKDTSQSEPEEDWLNDTERLLVALYQHMNSQFEQLFRRLDG